MEHLPSTAGEGSPAPGSKTREEILEEANAIRETLAQHRDIRRKAAMINERAPKLIIITGSGTSFHAASAAVYFLHTFARIPCYSVHPSEFPYFTKFILDEQVVVIPVSQSGESTDTINASSIATGLGSLVVPVVNESTSTLAKQYGENVLLTRAGKEHSVLATKTYTSQLALMACLALDLGLERGCLSQAEHDSRIKELMLVPDRIDVMREGVQEKAREIAKSLKFLDKAFVLGAGPDVATALEGALKLKEGARITAQGYSYFEFLHGPITLADRHNLIITIIPHLHDEIEDEREKGTLEIIKRVKRQGSSVLAIVSKSDEIPSTVDFMIRIPTCPMEFNPFLAIVPLQYLVLEIALQKGLDPDKPEWLTKVARI